MSAVMNGIFTSLHELEELVEKTSDPLEKEGLKAFINCITPRLVDEASFSLLGKITQTGALSVKAIEALTQEEFIAAIGSEYEITIE
ncbi:histidine kinase [Bacillus cereus]|uniref:histidine kinase n=1 Tax=Bacillus thuringiensis TaxID=1428 RepID=UPI000BF68A33|nr:histidine kinase [Bacillus thuringiensis]MEB9378457.1 histidine kinase [Bacillus cereus]PFR36725.1 histidine kinase [Bacillus thuringiensis]RAT01107.1 histidine kinase [Bacillus cereus]